MSKKTITFTLPPPRPQEVPPQAPDTDAWVLAGDGKSPPDERMLIDLSARRSWFELMQLIWAFPVMATWFWMAGIAQGERR
jgi:hypothetical protein